MLLDVRPDHLELVREILQRLVPDRDVWAFGSRAKWTARDTSDLDLCIVGDTPLGFKRLGQLRDASSESSLPYKVDVVDWATTNESFRTIIERDKVVVQRAANQPVEGEAGEWAEKSLGDLIEIKHGFAFKGEFFRDEPPGDILLTPGNFAIGGGFKADKFKHYDGPVPDEFVLREGDLIVTMTDLSKNADTLGYPAFVPSSSKSSRYLHNQRLGKVVATDREIVDFRYLHYLMCSQEYRHEVVASATGTTVKHTSPERIKRFRFRLPPLSEQRAIAHILGALDDKIELNRRMGETLEAMARALFKSWFVDFDPVRAKQPKNVGWVSPSGRNPPDNTDGGLRGYAANPPYELPPHIADLFPARLVDSELGEIPEGWKIGTFGDVAEHPRRGAHPDRIEPDTPYIALEHMPARCIGLSEWGTADGLESNKFEFKRGEILFGKLRPYFHKVGVAPVDGVCSTDIVVVKPRAEHWFGFVLGHVSSEAFVEYTNAGSTGTKMPRTSWGEMARYPGVLPPDPIARAFTAQIHPPVARILAAIQESRTLAALRDTLLPKLISGELRVPFQSDVAAKRPRHENDQRT